MYRSFNCEVNVIEEKATTLQHFRYWWWNIQSFIEFEQAVWEDLVLQFMFLIIFLMAMCSTCVKHLEVIISRQHRIGRAEYKNCNRLAWVKRYKCCLATLFMSPILSCHSFMSQKTDTRLQYSHATGRPDCTLYQNVVCGGLLLWRDRK
jgi:hypothetical protein